MDRLEESRIRNRNLHERAKRYQEDNVGFPEQALPNPYQQQPIRPQQPYQRPPMPPIPEPPMYNRDFSNIDVIKRIKALELKLDKKINIILGAVIITVLILVAMASGYLSINIG